MSRTLALHLSNENYADLWFVYRSKSTSAVLSDSHTLIYVFYRSNPKGIFYERWVHSHGCRKWFNAVRDTSTDTILKIYKLTDNKPDISEFQSSLKSPSGEPAVGSGNFAVKK